MGSSFSGFFVALFPYWICWNCQPHMHTALILAVGVHGTKRTFHFPLTNITLCSKQWIHHANSCKLVKWLAPCWASSSVHRAANHKHKLYILFSYETIILWGIIVPFAQFWSPPPPEGNIWLQQLNVGFIHEPIFSFIFYLPFLAAGLHSVFYQNRLACHQKIYESGESNDSSQKHQSNDDISRVCLNFTVCKYLSNLKMWFIEQFMMHESLFVTFLSLAWADKATWTTIDQQIFINIMRRLII